jgi:prepilin-type N-terminal cleavage/methylation domain-containing protein
MRQNRRTHGELTSRRPRRRGFSLLEVLIALTITLILMTLVVRVFQIMSDGVFHSRANMEMSDQVRQARHRLIRDLRGTTALTIPPVNPAWGVGYFEYHEGDIVAVSQGGDIGFRPTGTMGSLGTTTSGTPVVLTAYGDRDDFLLFTTASYDEPFVGRVPVNGQPYGARSRHAEVVWYPHVIEDAANANQQLMTLRRRQFLINSGYATGLTGYDTTSRNTLNGQQRALLVGAAGATQGNTLESLTKRENRMLHNNAITGTQLHPLVTGTLRRGIIAGSAAYPSAPFDFTTLTLTTAGEQVSSGGVEQMEHNQGNALARTTRESDDIILSSIIGFDVKAWDPGAPVFRVVGATGETDDVNKDLVGVVVPGDPGYLAAVQRFMAQPGSPGNQPVTFGAYADLNYMGYLVTQSGSFNPSAANFPETRYASALQTMASSVPGGYTLPYFAGPGHRDSKLQAYQHPDYNYFPATYDTFSRHYEYDGFQTINGTNGGASITTTLKRNHFYTNGGEIDAGMNMLDDNGNGLIDEPIERDAIPPYEKPLRGIRVSIRTIEPDSKQVREVTVVHEFIPL